MTKARWIGLGVGSLLILALMSVAVWQGASLLNSASAQTPSPTQTPNSVTKLVDAFWASLASKLGIGVSDLKTKVTDAQKDAIEQAVKDGSITRSQADTMEQRLSADKPFGAFGMGAWRKGFGQGFKNGFMEGMHGMRGGFGGGVNNLEAIASALNMKPADLTTQLQSGKTLADVAKAQGVDEAKVKQAIIDATKAQIQRAVTDGVMTQAQVDKILANLTLDKIDLTKIPGHRGMMGQPKTQPPSQTQ